MATYRTAVLVLVKVEAEDLEEAVEKLGSTSPWQDWSIESEVQWAREDGELV